MKERNLRIREFVFIIALLAAVLAASCKPKQEKATVMDSRQINADGIESVVDMTGMRVYCLQDKSTEHTADLFKGSYDDSLLALLLPGGSTPSAINAFLVSTMDHNILFDAGLGVERGGNMMAKMNYLKIKPEEIDVIMLTHLHPDHIGGLIKEGQPVFPNAEVYLSVEEFNAWADGGEMAAENGLWKEVLASYADKVRLFVDGDTLIDGMVEAHLAPGHTPGHTVYVVGECLMAGDLVHAQDLQMDYPQYCARYDKDKEKAVSARERWIDFAKARGLIFCGAHNYREP